MSVWSDFYSDPPSTFGLAPSDAQWFIDRIDELLALTPPLHINGPGTELWQGTLQARFDFASPLRDWSVLIAGSPAVVQFGCKMFNPVFLIVSGSQVSWGSLAALQLHYPYKVDVLPADWASRILADVVRWNPVL